MSKRNPRPIRTGEFLIEVLDSGFYEIPTKHRNAWLQKHYGFSYRSLYNYMKAVGLTVTRVG